MCTIQARRWCFTINNPTPLDLEQVRSLGESSSTLYLIFGREKGENETPHLQGFVYFTRGQRLSWCKKKLPRAHLEKTVADNQKNVEYCSKEGDFETFGALPDNQGKRTDLESVVKWIDEFLESNGRAPTEKEIAQAIPIGYVRYNKHLLNLAALRAPSPVLREGELRDWQVDAFKDLESDPNDREVRFYVDYGGGMGKTWFQQYVFTKLPDDVQLIGTGRKEDMSYAVDPSRRIFFINVARGSMQYLQYSILEDLKDRVIFSTKYQSTTKFISTVPHVWVFSNEDPDLERLSSDRYKIINL